MVNHISHMPQIAEILGVKINEPFAVCNRRDDTIAYFKLDIGGIYRFNPSTRGFAKVHGIKGDFVKTCGEHLENLLTGKTWIRKEQEQLSLFSIGWGNFRRVNK